ncbi:MAG: hypothetical protein JXR96_00915 [Deltaproteobacteria bacterium]|nr:hypothetical protein [Deltaproteobacteria bacterium]
MDSSALTRAVRIGFVCSLVLLPALLVAFAAHGSAGTVSHALHLLFAASVAVELMALVVVVVVCRAHEPGEPIRRTWILLAACLAVRLLAELRLGTLYLGWGPEGGSGLYVFYVIGLRYLYTASDLLFAAGLVSAMLSYRATGLPFGATWREGVYLAGILALPVLAFLLSPTMNAWFLPEAGDQVKIFRFTQVCVGSAVACLCVVLRRFALQMGAGALGRVWTAVWIGGLAHVASFLVFALMEAVWPESAELFEQYALWIYAGCWLVASAQQREIALLARRPQEEAEKE